MPEINSGEALNIQQPANAPVQIVQSTRMMKTFTITDSELRHLQLAGGLSTLFFSISSSLLTFGVSLIKDYLAKAGEVTESAKAVANVAVPICILFAVGFAMAGAWTFMWRHGTTKLIKAESGDTGPDNPGWMDRLFAQQKNRGLRR